MRSTRDVGVYKVLGLKPRSESCLCCFLVIFEIVFQEHMSFLSYSHTVILGMWECCCVNEVYVPSL